MANFEWGKFGGSPAEMVSIMAPALESSWSNMTNAFNTLSGDPSNTGYQLSFQYFSNISNITLQNTSQSMANIYDITKKILESTRS